MNTPTPLYAAPSHELYHGDMLEVMPTLAPGIAAMVFADLPYGETMNNWDIVVPLNRLFDELKRVCGKNSNWAFTANMRLAAALVCADPRRFKYDLVWHKLGRSSGHLNARNRPLRSHEMLLFFGKAGATYNPQKTMGTPYANKTKGGACGGGANYNQYIQKKLTCDGMRHPISILAIKRMNGTQAHPTQKPVALLEWLIATYTNPGDTVLDPCFGSNTTGVACARLGRNYIGIEKDAGYFAAGKARLEAEHARLAAAAT